MPEVVPDCYVFFRKLENYPEGFDLPEYQTSGSSGMDLRSAIDTAIYPGQWTLVPTGLALSIAKGLEAQVRSRSGLAFKHGVFVLNGVGTVDSDYTGPLGALLFNAGPEPFCINKGDRIAQLVIARVLRAGIGITDTVGKTDRGAGGFGSTGV